MSPAHYGCRMSIPAASPWAFAWVRTPFWRILGSFASWYLFALCMMLLLQGFLSLMAIGGSCASGGPYVIETECPDAVALFMPLSIFGGLASVAISVIFAQGFGTSLTDLAWPVLFGSLGAGFVASMDAVGFIVGGVFLAMAIVPLVIALRASPQRVFLGAVSARGLRFYEGENPRFSLVGIRYRATEQTVRADGGHWALALIVCFSAIALGYYSALEAYASV